MRPDRDHGYHCKEADCALCDVMERLPYKMPEGVLALIVTDEVYAKIEDAIEPQWRFGDRRVGRQNLIVSSNRGIRFVRQSDVAEDASHPKWGS